MKEKAALTDLYYRIWAFAMPVTSFLVIPSIQGTTIGYLMCFLSVPLVLLFGGRARKSWMHFVGAAVIVWLLMFCTSQVADIMAPWEPDFTKVVLVDETDPFTFIMLGRVCEVGQGCQCSITTGRTGCMTSYSIQCTGSSES